MVALKRNVLHVLGFCVFFAFYACGSTQGDPDRAGELGRAKLTGGGGCNNSTTLALGSRTVLTIETESGEDPPSNLTVTSTSKSITAVKGPRPDTVTLAARSIGETYVELRKDGSVWDRVRFSAEPATRVDLDQPVSKVFAGGTYVLKLGEVYGACGEGCPLIGGSFLRWSASPAAGLTVVDDVERTATFTAAGTAGNVTLEGIEPSSGRMLVEHKLTVLPVAQAGGLTAEAVVVPARNPGEELKVLDPAALPLTVTVGSMMMFRVRASCSDGGKVMVWGRDLAWTVEGDRSAVAVYPQDGRPVPAEGPVFSAKAPGKVTLVGAVKLLGKTVRVDVTVKPAGS